MTTVADFCSLTGARTFIDTNLAHIDTILAGNVVKYLAAGSATGVEAARLGDVLHEAVHHWCFNSPVGNALTALRAELVEAAFDNDPKTVVETYGRYSAAVRLLRPILEGLACFAEFDAYPGAGNHRAEPLTWLSAVAFPREAFDPDSRRALDVDPLIRRTLRDYRQLESTAVRKDTLLCQPLDPDASGGYLLGYLLVKGSRTAALRLSRTAVDTELWLCFVRAWVLFDLDLAALLLEPRDSDDLAKGGSAVVTRLSRRIRELADPSIVVPALELYNASRDDGFADSVEEADAAALGMTPAARRRVESAGRRHLERLESGHPDESIRAIRFLTATVSQTRDWICIATARGTVRADAAGKCAFTDDEGMPRFVVGAKEHPGMTFIDYEGPAALELWIGPPGDGAALVVASIQGVHGWMEMWAPMGGTTLEFLSTARSNAALLDITASVRKLVDELLELQPWWEQVRSDFAGAQQDALLDQAVLALALYGSGEDPVESPLWNDGFFSVFRSAELLQAVSAFGLLTSVGDDLDPDSRAHLSPKVPLLADVDGWLHGLRLADLDEGRVDI